MIFYFSDVSKAILEPQRKPTLIKEQQSNVTICYMFCLPKQIEHITKRSKGKHISLISLWILLVMVFKRSNSTENVFLAKLKYLILTFTWTWIYLRRLSLTALVNLKAPEGVQAGVCLPMLSLRASSRPVLVSLGSLCQTSCSPLH